MIHVSGSVLIPVLIISSVYVTRAEPFADYLQNEGQEYVANSRADQDDRDSAHKESLIVQDVYSPDYYEPNIILDYRYLKSGGREYTRGDGGQILILPRRNRGAQMKHNNYDVLLEHLRKKRLAELHKFLGHDTSRKPNGFQINPELYETIEEAVEEEGGYLRTYQHRG